MISLVYVSAAVRPFEEADLAGLLRVSRRNNERSGITGMLLYMGGNFMQAIEGEEASIDALGARIRTDERHRRMITILRTPIAARQFADWSMGFANIDKLPDADRRGFSAFLSGARSDERTAETPHVALRLLERFRRTMR